MRLIDADKMIELVKEIDARPDTVVLADAEAIINFINKMPTVETEWSLVETPLSEQSFEVKW